MTRDVPDIVQAELGRPVVRPFTAAELELDSQPFRFWDGIGPLVFNGQTFTGAGHLLSIGDVQETADLTATRASVTLSGIPNQFLTAAVTENYQGRPGRIWLGFLIPGNNQSSRLLLPDGSGHLLFPNGDFIDVSFSTADFAVLNFEGVIDQMPIARGPGTSTITATMTSDLARLKRPVVRRYTHEDQQSRHTNDDIFKFVTRLQNESIDDWAG